MNAMRRLTWQGWLLALGFGLLAACQPAEPPNAERLRFGMDLWPGYFPAVIAEHEGLMAQNGVALETKLTRDTSAMIAGFAAGEYDLIAVSLGDAITLSRSRPDVMVLLMADESRGGDQLLRAPGVGENPTTSPSTLRLGTDLGGFGELFVRAWLEREGLDPSKVTWTDTDASEVKDALLQGRIDYGHTWRPYADEAKAAGATMVFSSADTPGLILDVVLTTREVVERHPEAVRGFARAWFEAEARWRADSAWGLTISEKALGLTPGSVSREGIAVSTLEDNRKAMAGGAHSPLAQLVDRYARFFVERGSLSQSPESTALFDPSLLPAEAPGP